MGLGHGNVHRKEMNTGDSCLLAESLVWYVHHFSLRPFPGNYISPFVPHSFTARAGSPEAIIIAAPWLTGVLLDVHLAKMAEFHIM